MDVIAPSPGELDLLSNIYIRIVEEERASVEDCAKLRALAHTLVDREHLDAILLAGTDLSLVFNPENTDFPHLDGARTHIDAIMHKLAPKQAAEESCFGRCRDGRESTRAAESLEMCPRLKRLSDSIFSIESFSADF